MFLENLKNNKQSRSSLVNNTSEIENDFIRNVNTISALHGVWGSHEGFDIS